MPSGGLIGCSSHYAHSPNFAALKLGPKFLFPLTPRWDFKELGLELNVNAFIEYIYCNH